MTKRFVCAALLVCSFATHAAEWQREFFTPLPSNELPPSRGVVVDDEGHVHLQAFNRFPWSTGYDFVHQYSINAQGQTPWGWGLSQTDRMSSCGVYAQSGQRLDCMRRMGFSGLETRLEMRGAQNTSVTWHVTLPSDAELLDASIPQTNEALLVVKLSGGLGNELAILRATGFGAADVEVLSVSLACQQVGQTPIASHLRMPTRPDDSIRHVKTCRNSFGTTELILEEFDLHARQWTTLSTLPIAYDASVLRAGINAEGRAFALVTYNDGSRFLARTPIYADQWESVPFPAEGKVIGFLAGSQGLVVVTLSETPDIDSLGLITSLGSYLTPVVSWFDLNGPYWPMMHRLEKFGDIGMQGFGLSSNGALIVAGSETSQPRAQLLWLADRDGLSRAIAALPLTADEISIGTPYVLGGPNNVAVIARTITRVDGFGNLQTGVRVNQFDLQM